MFGWLFKKKEEEVEEPEFTPRIWAFPRDKVLALLEIREKHNVQHPTLQDRFAYYTALADAGFDGFGHGNWVFRYSGSNNGHNRCFPVPYLEEIDPESIEEEE